MSEPTATQTRKQTALMKRLARILEHKSYEKVIQHVPPAEEDLEVAATSSRRGWMLAVLAVIAAIIGVTGSGLGTQVPAFLVAGPFMILAGRMIVKGSQLRSKVLADSLERRAALVADRRSETTENWFGGRTTYYFQLEFDDGTNGEYRYPGRGVQDDLLVKGNTGVAFLRGRTLIAWKNIKV